MRDLVSLFAAADRPRRTSRPSSRWTREDITGESALFAAWEDAHPESSVTRCACGRTPRPDGTCPKHAMTQTTRRADDL